METRVKNILGLLTAACVVLVSFAIAYMLVHRVSIEERYFQLERDYAPVVIEGGCVTEKECICLPE